MTYPVVRFLAEDLPCTESLRTEIRERLRHEQSGGSCSTTCSRAGRFRRAGLPLRVESGVVLIGPVTG